jgi:hypothetical protein
VKTQYGSDIDAYFEDIHDLYDLEKAPRGGISTPISQSPWGLPGTSSRVPPQNSQYRGGPPSVITARPSVYSDGSGANPPPFIDDVDMAGNWYSPFQPVWPFGPPFVNRPREWDYPVGYNLNFINERITYMQILRAMRQSWGVLAGVIETRKDQLLRIPWTIQVKDKPRATNAGVKAMRKFFSSPDSKIRYNQWARKVLDDLFVIDAPAIFFSRDRRGRPLSAEAIDGATIFPLIDDMGRRPGSVVEINDAGMQYLKRQPAFQQIIKGLPLVDLDESQLLYAPMRPRTDLPVFGFSPIEQILIEATEAARKTQYQVNFWSEGTIPDLIVTVPDNWSPRQIAMFQGHFDAMLSGNLRLKSKVRFIPGGMKPFDIKNSSGESLWSQRDETLIRLCCYVYSVSPTPFVKQTNRATAQNAQETAQEEGLYPLMSYWKEVIIDPIIEMHGMDDVEFTFLPRPEVDMKKQADIHQIYVRDGLMTVNEAREQLGLEPIEGGDVPMIFTQAGAFPLDQASRGEIVMPGAQVSGEAAQGKTTPSAKPPKAPGQSNPQRGIPRPNTASTSPPVDGKALRLLIKGLKRRVKDATREATGGIDNYSHLVLHTGNYKKGHVWIQGLDISIENAKGSKRGEKDAKGKKWEVKMPAPYGYIRGTIGADGMQMDCYLGKDPKFTTVWVIDQDEIKNGKNHGFDEHKVFIGYRKLKRAVKDYLLSHFDGHGLDRLAAITEISMDDFKSWLAEGDLKKPISDQNFGTVVDRTAIDKAADTVSLSTNLVSYDQNTVPRRRKRKRSALARGPRWLELRA